MIGVFSFLPRRERTKKEAALTFSDLVTRYYPDKIFLKRSINGTTHDHRNSSRPHA